MAMGIALGLILVVGYWLSSWVLMLAWNAFAPTLFGFPILGLGQAFGMLVVASIIGSCFKSNKG